MVYVVLLLCQRGLIISISCVSCRACQCEGGCLVLLFVSTGAYQAYYFVSCLACQSRSASAHDAARVGSSAHDCHCLTDLWP